MNKVFRQTLIVTLFFLATSCSKNPFTAPWSYAPTAPNKVWQVSVKEKRKLEDIDPIECLQIPAEEGCISLGDLFDIALHNSPETKESWEEARERAAGYSSTLSSYLPSLSVDASYTATKQGFVYKSLTSINQYEKWGPELNISYLLWDSGERKSVTEKAFQLLQESNHSHNESIQSVMLNVASYYYDVLYAKALLEANEADLKNAAQTYKAAQDKGECGIYDETDIMQAKTNYLKAKVSVNTQTATLKNNFVGLLTVMGIPINADFSLGNFPSKEPLDPFLACEEELIEVAKIMRPDLLAAKAEIMSSEANIKEKKAKLLPNLNFTGQTGKQWYNSGGDDSGNYSFQLNLNIPIFTGFFHLNKIKQAESELEKMVAKYREIELRVFQKVRRSHNNLVMSKQQIIDTYEYLNAAEVEFKAMFERYEIGIVNILDLLKSESFLSDARAQYTLSQKLYYMSIIDIAYATGMLTNSCPWNMEENK